MEWWVYRDVKHDWQQDCQPALAEIWTHEDGFGNKMDRALKRAVNPP